MRWLRRRSDDDYRAEIETHLEAEMQANIERGMSLEEARRAARVSFGGVAGVRQQLHEGRSGWWLDALASDVRYGVRMIRRNWLLSSVVALIMSLGIGSTTAVFSVVNVFAFAAPVVDDPGSFVLFVSPDQGYQVATTKRYEALRRQTRSLRELAAWSQVPLSAPLGSTNAASVQGVLATCNVLTVFSTPPPLAGRLLNEEDCTTAAPVAVISRNLWRTRFASDPAVVGTGISYGGHSLTIVGVAAVPSLPDGSAADIWLPYSVRSTMADVLAYGDALDSDEFYWLGMAGRLAPGYSRRAAASEFEVLTGREEPRDPELVVDLKLTNGSLWSMAPAETLWMFSAALAFPTLVLLIVCATVATLLLSRAVGRQREMAIRLAVGGSKLGLVRMLLVESVLLAGMAAVIGLAFVYALPPLILRQWFALPSGVAPSMVDPDFKVIVYMGTVTIFAAVCAGLAPALESLNLKLGESLKGRLVLGGRRGISLTRGVLVGAQVAFCMVLLVAAAALVRADRWFANPGFEARQIVVAQLPRTPTAHTPASLAAMVGSLPAVRSVAYAESLPLVFEEATILQDASQGRHSILSARISPAYFDTLGIRILSGRPFRDDDSARKGGGGPVVVSRQFARRFFSGQDPLGRMLTELGPGGRLDPLEIVGVAANRSAGFGPLRVVNDGSFVYKLMEPSVKGFMLVRVDGNVSRLTSSLQSALKQGTGLVVPVSTLQSNLELRMARLRGFETLLAAMGAIGLALALAGVFGILAFTAAQRRKEMAIRTALGARRIDIFGTMVLPTFRPTGIGIALGAFLSFAALRVAESQRQVPLGYPSTDPIPYLAGGLLLLGAAFAAMSGPAYRATLSEPARALRED